ncbi:MAG TPA: methyl-accepting chemotaxis protein II, partial [Erwinia persicina]|nr:methyl-accepting chemotaxis protein II [Erwinia persicina]
MFTRMKVVTSLILVLVFFGSLQLITGGLFFQALKGDKDNFAVSQQLRLQQSALNQSWIALIQARNTLNRSGIRYTLDANREGISEAVKQLLADAQGQLTLAEKNYALWNSRLTEQGKTADNVLAIQKNYDILHSALSELIQLMNAGKINEFFDQPTQGYQDGFAHAYDAWLTNNDAQAAAGAEENLRSYGQAIWILGIALVV